MKKLGLALVSLVILVGVFGCGSDGVSSQQAQSKKDNMDKLVNDAGAKDHLRN